VILPAGGEKRWIVTDNKAGRQIAPRPRPPDLPDAGIICMMASDTYRCAAAGGCARKLIERTELCCVGVQMVALGRML
jgi:hypothetical protein